MFWKFFQLFYFPNQSDISGRFQTNNNFVFPNRFDALQSQDARRAAEHRAKAAGAGAPVAPAAEPKAEPKVVAPPKAEPKVVAPPKAKAASWLSWFGQNRFKKHCGSFIQTLLKTFCGFSSRLNLLLLLLPAPVQVPL